MDGAIGSLALTAPIRARDARSGEAQPFPWPPPAPIEPPLERLGDIVTGKAPAGVTAATAVGLGVTLLAGFAAPIISGGRIPAGSMQHGLVTGLAAGLTISVAGGHMFAAQPSEREPSPGRITAGEASDLRLWVPLGLGIAGGLTAATLGVNAAIRHASKGVHAMPPALLGGLLAAGVTYGVVKEGFTFGLGAMEN